MPDAELMLLDMLLTIALTASPPPLIAALGPPNPPSKAAPCQ
jgi:hypothetical protein